MPATTDEAVALRHLDFSETSQVLVLLTRGHGRLRVIAKGIRRGPRGGVAPGIDLLEYGWASFVARPDRADRLVPLTEWKQRSVFAGLRERLGAYWGGMYAAEATAGLTEDYDPHPALFDALVGTLSALARGEEPLSCLIGYQWTLLREAGLQPVWDRCVSCGRAAGGGSGWYFSGSSGGLICRDCEPAVADKRSVPPGLVGRRPVDLASGEREAGFAMLDDYIASLIGRPLRTGSFLRSRGVGRSQG